MRVLWGPCAQTPQINNVLNLFLLMTNKQCVRFISINMWCLAQQIHSCFLVFLLNFSYHLI